jgi:peptidoglycan-associated lipoprotein
MKVTKFTNLLVLGLVLTVAACGCRKHPTPLTVLPGYAGSHPGDADTNAKPIGMDTDKPVASTTESIPANDPKLHEGWPEDRTIFAGNTVHFALDSSAVKESEKGNVTAVADYLKGHADTAVKVEGHCDERGTAEYNRSLGERRATALREELVKLGIPSTSVDTITYGFEQPVDPGHDESAWAKNRRGVFVLLTKPTASAAK